MPMPPSSYAALAGATVVANLSASNILIGKEEYRRQLVGNQSARCLAAYLYSAAGMRRIDHRPRLGRPWGDLRKRHAGRRVEALRRHAAARRGRHRPRAPRRGPHAPEHLRRRGAAPSRGRAPLSAHRVELALPRRRRSCSWSGEWTRFPTCPADPATRDARCEEVSASRCTGWSPACAPPAARSVVIGVSGGLDSTHALLVCARAMDHLGLPRANILAYTMPGFATSERTKSQALAADACDRRARAEEIDIRPACMQMLKDIGHPYAKGSRSTTSRSRTCRRGSAPAICSASPTSTARMVVGTGDLSELALGWCTYGVGDHMSHYNVERAACRRR